MGGVPVNSYARWHIANDDRTHPNGCALTNRHALLNHGPSSDIHTIPNGDSAVATDARREGNVVSDHAFVRNVAIDIGVEVPADLGVRFDKGMVRDNRTISDAGVRGTDGGPRHHGAKAGQLGRDALADVRASDGNAVFGVFRTFLHDRNTANRSRLASVNEANIVKGLERIEHLKGEAASTVNSKHDNSITENAGSSKEIRP